MITILQKIYSARIYDIIEAWIPPKVINSFDCARFSMGVAQIVVDTVVVLPKICISGMALGDKITILEAHAKLLEDTINNLISCRYLGVWNLGKVDHAWEVAPPLNRRLLKMDNKFGTPDVLLYEFQMSANDKSRMVSTMLAYHYCKNKTVRIAPAVKNTIIIAKSVSRDDFSKRCGKTAMKKTKNAGTGKMCTIVSLLFDGYTHIDLSIQSFLRICTETYKANKLHTSAMLEWWAYIFSVDLQYVPKDCLDDAADAFIQTLGAIRRDMI